MPSVSKAQNAAMWSARSGHSTLGIPASVGREFTDAQAPGSVKKLPVHKAGGGGLSGLQGLFGAGAGLPGFLGGQGGSSLGKGSNLGGTLGSWMKDRGGAGINMPFQPGQARPAPPSPPLPQPTAPVSHYAPPAPMPGMAGPAGPTNAQPFAAGGGAQTPWFVRNEARSMVHTGPIRSPVAGRTDHIPLKVPGGSYVLPADHISHMGQNNTEAGMARAAHMFGGSGPFGSSLPKMTHGRGAPSAPPVPRPSPSPSLGGFGQTTRTKGPMIFAHGGANYQGGVTEGDDPVDIMAAGGEFVVPPNIVRAIGDGNINHGHQILDRWVVQEREKHKKTLAKLPPPAK